MSMMTYAIALLLAIGAVVATIAVVGYVKRNRRSTGWVIGPILPDGKNTSKGYPERPLVRAGVECAFDFVPGQYNHVHYLTCDRGPVVGRSLLIDYEIIADEGARFFSQEGNGVAWITPFLQRKGDDFTAVGDKTYWRFWANWFTEEIRVGRRALVVPLDPHYWRHTMGDTEDGFWQPLLDSEGRWGLTFGGPTGLGHGVYCIGEARFVLHRFEVLS